VYKKLFVLDQRGEMKYCPVNYMRLKVNMKMLNRLANPTWNSTLRSIVAVISDHSVETDGKIINIFS
jgi:hypothetical protein